jgi:hypothetical protein
VIAGQFAGSLFVVVNNSSKHLCWLITFLNWWLFHQAYVVDFDPFFSVTPVAHLMGAGVLMLLGVMLAAADE